MHIAQHIAKRFRRFILFQMFIFEFKKGEKSEIIVLSSLLRKCFLYLLRQHFKCLHAQKSEKLNKTTAKKKEPSKHKLNRNNKRTKIHTKKNLRILFCFIIIFVHFAFVFLFSIFHQQLILYYYWLLYNLELFCVPCPFLVLFRQYNKFVHVRSACV